MLFIFLFVCVVKFLSVSLFLQLLSFFIFKNHGIQFSRLSSNYLDQVRALADIDEHVEEGHVYDIIVKVFLEAIFIETHIIALKQKW